jgi:MSHA biogenesis protein MshJ
VVLYRHGLRLQLQGGYFDLLSYLQAIQGSGWMLNWDSLDYRVGKAGPGQAQISLKLYTLSRQAGWVGV